MNHFDADRYFEELTTGVFDGRIQDELRKLTRPQLEQVAAVMKRHFANLPIGNKNWGQLDQLINRPVSVGGLKNSLSRLPEGGT